MILRLFVFIMFLLALRPAMGQTVSIASGEHDGFTRLVLTLPQPADWRVGRTEDGYVFRIVGVQPRYDLSRVFDRINRQRLASIWADPGDGGLRIGIACPCHALPFEFRPGTIVIDLRDGQPPPGSSFEQTLDGQVMPALAANRPIRPRPRSLSAPLPFDWRDAVLGGRWSGQTQGMTVPLPVPDRQLMMVEESLRMDLSRAIAEGLVEPVSRPPSAPPQKTRPAPDSPNLRLGPPLDVRSALSSAEALSAQGAVCPTAESLAISDWGDARPVSVQMAEAMVNLTGEFDRPDSAAARRAVRFLLHLGFGAEALALMSALPSEDTDKPLWQSMARLVDGNSDPDGAFAGHAACDTPAALWASLADPSLSPTEINAAALLRAFSALPPHLRRHLGPTLAERFLAADDKVTATALQDSLLRLPGPPDPRTAILSARLSSAQGAAPAATEQLEAVLSDPGPSQLQALLALVELHAAEARPLDPAQADAVAAFLAEAEGTPEEPALARAQVLALALTDRFDAAFAALPAAPEAAPDLWRLLSGGPDSAVLLHALGTAPEDLPADVSQSVRDALAARLHTLGFPDQARRWSALPPPQASSTLSPGSSAIRQRDWAAIGSDAPAPWQDLTAALPPVEFDAATPLARGRALTAASAETRAAVRELLSTLPAP
jgi:hypothetical protein